MLVSTAQGVQGKEIIAQYAIFECHWKTVAEEQRVLAKFASLQHNQPQVVGSDTEESINLDRKIIDSEIGSFLIGLEVGKGVNDIFKSMKGLIYSGFGGRKSLISKIGKVCAKIGNVLITFHSKIF